MEKSENADSSSITRSAFKVMAGGILSLSAGLVNQIAIAAFYGAGAGMDAYLTASVVPAYFQYVLLSGLSFVFIPAFVREEAAGKEEDAWALAGTFFWIVTIGLFGMAILGAIFSAQVIAVSAPGFGAEKSALAARMLSVLMFVLPFTGLSSLTTGIQNARNRFFWPSFAGALNSIANLVVILCFGKTIGPMALCWGFLFSMVAQSLVTIIPVVRHGWKRTLPLNDSRVMEMGKLITPLILFGLLTQSTMVVERYFSSRLPDGEISYIGYANKVSDIFVTLLSVGISSAIFPSMARAYVSNGVKGLEEKNDYGLRLTCAVGIPAVIITGAIAIPLIHVLFQRGEFHSVATRGVSVILTAVLLRGVLFRMVSNILGRTSYVLKDTITPSLISSITILLYIAASNFFVTKWGYIGLVWVRTIQTALSVIVLWIVIQRKLPRTHLMETLRRIVDYSLASVAAYFVGRVVVEWLGSLPAILQLAAGGLVGVALYLLILYWRDQEMLTAIKEMSGAERIFPQLQHVKARHEPKSIRQDVS